MEVGSSRYCCCSCSVSAAGEPAAAAHVAAEHPLSGSQTARGDCSVQQCHWRDKSLQLEAQRRRRMMMMMQMNYMSSRWCNLEALHKTFPELILTQCSNSKTDIMLYVMKQWLERKSNIYGLL